MTTIATNTMTADAYQAEVRRVLGLGEGSRNDIYADSQGIPTTGIGYALVVRGSDGLYAVRTNEELTLHLAGTGLSLSAQQRTDLTAAANRLNEGGSLADKISYVNATLQRPSLDAFNITNEQAGTLRDNVVNEYENWLTNIKLSTRPELAQALSNSNERALLIELAYHKNGVQKRGHKNGVRVHFPLMAPPPCLGRPQWSCDPLFDRVRPLVRKTPSPLGVTLHLVHCKQHVTTC